MSHIPQVSGCECVRAFERAGFVVRRQRGSHIILTREDPYAQIVIPDHKEIAPGTMRNILRQAGITIDQFINLLK